MRTQCPLVHRGSAYQGDNHCHTSPFKFVSTTKYCAIQHSIFQIFRADFLRSDFTVDKFFIEQSIRETPLDNLRDDLGLYLKVLRSSMIELINQVGGPLYLESKFWKQLFTRILSGLCRLCELVDKSGWSGWGNPSSTGVECFSSSLCPLEYGF